MRAGDLTTVSNVKQWLGLAEGSATDPLLARLISGASSFIYNRINRTTFGYQLITRAYDGTGKDFLVLRDYPVQQMISISFGGFAAIPAGAIYPATNGYLLEPPAATTSGQRLSLRGYCFPPGRGSVLLSYMAGYVASEALVIPSALPQLVASDLWIDNIDVTTAGGVILTRVASAPAAGQYAVNGGTYTFNAADGGTAIVIRYSYVPADIEQVACELVGLRMKTKSRIGISSQSLAGKETVTYFGSKDLNGVMSTVLAAYMNKTPY